MYLRDYFAAKALGGMLGNISHHKDRAEIMQNSVIIATASYKLADAMMEARKV